MTIALAGMAEAGIATSLDVSMGAMGAMEAMEGRVMGMVSRLLTCQDKDQDEQGERRGQSPPTVMGCFMFLTTSSVKGMDDWIGLVIMSFTSLFQALLVL